MQHMQYLLILLFPVAWSCVTLDEKPIWSLDQEASRMRREVTLQERKNCGGLGDTVPVNRVNTQER